MLILDFGFWILGFKIDENINGYVVPDALARWRLKRPQIAVGVMSVIISVTGRERNIGSCDSTVIGPLKRVGYT